MQEAKARGLSSRGIARELGIHRNTARKYAAAESRPVTARPKFPVALADTMNDNAEGHFRRTSAQVSGSNVEPSR